MSEPNTVPPNSTPTWQMELIISGGLVVALFQILAWLDANTRALISPLRVDNFVVATLVFLYSYAALLCSGTAFVIHLLLRSLWVAIVGVQSIYPKGIVWDQTFGSAKTRHGLQERLKDPQQITERLDNLSTLVFAFGCSVSATIMASALVFIGLMALFALTAWVLPANANVTQVSFLIITGMVIALVALQIIDSLPDRVLGAGNILRRFAQKTTQAVASSPPTPLIYLSSLMLSNLGRWRGMTIFALAMFVAIGSGYLKLLSMVNDAPDLFYGEQRFVSEVYYADTRPPDALYNAPYISSAQPTQAWIKLNIPFQRRLFADYFKKLCKLDNKANLQFDDARLTACAQQIFEPKLASAPLLGSFELVENRSNSTYELQLVIDLQALAHGRHEITLRVPKQSEQDQAKLTAQKFDQYRIPFWR